jgi:predicted glycosyltransferase
MFLLIMKVLFYLSHPAQFHFSKNAVEELKNRNHTVEILAKTKDVLTTLIDEKGWKYYNIQTKERKQSKLSIILSLLKRDFKLLLFCLNKKFDVLIGTDASLAHVGFILRIPVITVLEDDYDVVKVLARLTFPFTSYILTPSVCKVGKWKNKKIGYNGYMKLAYLHPYRFIPNYRQLGFPDSLPYFLIRLSGLKAHHDFGIGGITDIYLDQIIEKLSRQGKVYISSEKQLPKKYDKYILHIPASRIHHFLYYAEMLVCDSQSMAVEAAMLGTPSIRVSSFSGRISVLEELEKKYHLTFGFTPEKIFSALQKIDILLKMADRRSEFRKRRERMLDEKIEVTGFLVWLIENFPKSIRLLAKDPEYQNRFIAKHTQKELLTYQKIRHNQSTLISNSN